MVIRVLAIAMIFSDFDRIVQFPQRCIFSQA